MRVVDAINIISFISAFSHSGLSLLSFSLLSKDVKVKYKKLAGLLYGETTLTTEHGKKPLQISNALCDVNGLIFLGDILARDKGYLWAPQHYRHGHILHHRPSTRAVPKFSPAQPNW